MRKSYPLLLFILAVACGHPNNRTVVISKDSLTAYVISGVDTISSMTTTIGTHKFIDNAFHVCVIHAAYDSYKIQWHVGNGPNTTIMESFWINNDLGGRHQEKYIEGKDNAVAYAKTLLSAEQCVKINDQAEKDFIPMVERKRAIDSIRNQTICVK